MPGSPLVVEGLVFEFKDALEKIRLIGQRERVRLLDRPFDCFVKRLVATRFAELDIDDFAQSYRVFVLADRAANDAHGLLIDGMSQLVLSLTIGGQSLWAFSTTTEDVTIRNHLYQRLGPSEALRRLARRFPGGSAKAEVERRRRQVEDRSDSDDEVVNVILEIANELAEEQ